MKVYRYDTCICTIFGDMVHVHVQYTGMVHVHVQYTGVVHVHVQYTGVVHVHVQYTGVVHVHVQYIDVVHVHVQYMGMVLIYRYNFKYFPFWSFVVSAYKDTLIYTHLLLFHFLLLISQ